MSQFSAAAGAGRRLSITTTQPLKRPSARPWSPNGTTPTRSFTMQQQTSGFHSGGCNGGRSCTCPFFDESNAHEWPKCVAKKQAMMQRQSSSITMASGTTTGAASRMQQTRAFNTSAKQSSATATAWSQSSSSTSTSQGDNSQRRGGNDAWDGLTFS